MKQKEINEQISFLSPCYSSLFLAIQISFRALLPSPLPPLPRNWLAWPYQAALTLFSLLSSCRSLSAFLSTYVSPVHNVAVSTSSSTFFPSFFCLPICQPVASCALPLRLLRPLFSRCTGISTVEARVSATHSRGARVQGEWHVHVALPWDRDAYIYIILTSARLSRTANYLHVRACLY